METSSAALLERSDQMNGHSISGLDGHEHCQRKPRRELWVVRRLNELIFRAGDYLEYKLVITKGD